MGSNRISDANLERVLASIAPSTLPIQAFGPRPVEWFERPRPVWAWVQWPHRAAERVACWAHAANDRVVFLRVPCDGGYWEPVVWRHAVRMRTPEAR